MPPRPALLQVATADLVCLIDTTALPDVLHPADAPSAHLAAVDALLCELLALSPSGADGPPDLPAAAGAERVVIVVRGIDLSRASRAPATAHLPSQGHSLSSDARALSAWFPRLSAVHRLMISGRQGDRAVDRASVLDLAFALPAVLPALPAGPRVVQGDGGGAGGGGGGGGGGAQHSAPWDAANGALRRPSVRSARLTLHHCVEVTP